MSSAFHQLVTPSDHSQSELTEIALLHGFPSSSYKTLVSNTGMVAPDLSSFSDTLATKTFGCAFGYPAEVAFNSDGQPERL
jgi:hypothetical protein